MASGSCVDFLQNFVLPLVVGGEMHVAEPIDVPQLQAFEHELGEASAPLMAIDDAREAIIAGLVVKPPHLLLGIDELSLAAAVHNLLYLAHPDARTSSAAREKVLRSAQHFSSRALSGNRIRLLARHALLHNIFDIARKDVKVAWWTGSADFLGQVPPQRLSRWGDLRRVRRIETRTDFSELFDGPGVVNIVGSLLKRSPLSQVLLLGPHSPLLHWEDVVALLRDAELARAIAYNALDGGGLDGRSLLGASRVGQRFDKKVDAMTKMATPARFAVSFEQMLSRSPPEEDVRTVAAFLVHLNCLLALDELNLREESPLLAATLGAKQRVRGLATFLALPAALALVDPRLSVPLGTLSEPILAARWAVHRAQVAEAVGEPLIQGLADRLHRHLVHSEPAVLETAVLESPTLQKEDGTASA